MGNNTQSVYGIDVRTKTFHYYASQPDGHTVHEITSYRSRNFDEEFYQFFTEAVQEYTKLYTPSQASDTTIVLPDEAIFTSTLSFPTMGSSALKSTINSTLDGEYLNRKSLTIKTFTALQTKHLVTSCVVGVQSSIISDIKASFAALHLVPGKFTFASNATVNAVTTMMPKLKSSTYMLLDVKEDFTRMIYVYKGHVTGFMTLPFGYTTIEKTKPVSEDMLFDHSAAELAVLNAREKAKAKALTMMGGDNSDAVAAGEEGEEGGESTDSFATASADPTIATHSESKIKTLPKKVARKLPKFMLRPTPVTDEDAQYENFRIFVKWALTCIAGNDAVVSLAQPEAVYVNMPSQFDFIYNMVNAEEEENGIKFLPLGINKEKEEIVKNLEYYGGFFAKKMNDTNNF